MKRRLADILFIAILGVFVNFAFGNTVFTHSHSGLNGATTTHSHPFIPSGQHSHSAASIDQIAGMNSSAQAVEASASTIIDSFLECSAIIRGEHIEKQQYTYTPCSYLRGPPCV